MASQTEVITAAKAAAARLGTIRKVAKDTAAKISADTANQATQTTEAGQNASK